MLHKPTTSESQIQGKLELRDSVTANITCLIEHPHDNTHFIAGYGDGTFKIIPKSYADQDELYRYPQKRKNIQSVSCVNPITSLAIMPEGELVTGYCGENPGIQFWDISDIKHCKPISEIIPIKCQPYFLTTHDSTSVLYGDFSQTLWCCDVNQGYEFAKNKSFHIEEKNRILGCLSGAHTDESTHVVSKQLIILTQSGIRLLDLDSSTTLQFASYPGIAFPTTILHLQLDTFLLGDSEGKISIWNIHANGITPTDFVNYEHFPLQDQQKAQNIATAFTSLTHKEGRCFLATKINDPDTIFIFTVPERFSLTNSVSSSLTIAPQTSANITCAVPLDKKYYLTAYANGGLFVHKTSEPASAKIRQLPNGCYISAISQASNNIFIIAVCGSNGDNFIEVLNYPDMKIRDSLKVPRTPHLLAAVSKDSFVYAEHNAGTFYFKKFGSTTVKINVCENDSIRALTMTSKPNILLITGKNAVYWINLTDPNRIMLEESLLFENTDVMTTAVTRLPTGEFAFGDDTGKVTICDFSNLQHIRHIETLDVTSEITPIISLSSTADGKLFVLAADNLILAETCISKKIAASTETSSVTSALAKLSILAAPTEEQKTGSQHHQGTPRLMMNATGP